MLALQAASATWDGLVGARKKGEVGLRPTTRAPSSILAPKKLLISSMRSLSGSSVAHKHSTGSMYRDFGAVRKPLGALFAASPRCTGFQSFQIFLSLFLHLCYVVLPVAVLTVILFSKATWSPIWGIDFNYFSMMYTMNNRYALGGHGL